jgi:hypothetical protein
MLWLLQVWVGNKEAKKIIRAEIVVSQMLKISPIKSPRFPFLSIFVLYPELNPSIPKVRT